MQRKQSPCLASVILLATALTCTADDKQAAKDATVVQTLLRLPNIDVNSRPKLRDAVLRHLETKRGTVEYVELVERLKLRGVESQLLQMAMDDPEGNVGVNAATLLAKRDAMDLFSKVLVGDDESAAVKVATVLGFLGTRPATDQLRTLVTDSNRGRALRAAATAGLGRSRDGQLFLLDLARNSKLPADINFAAANALFGSVDAAVRSEAAKYLELPAGADSKPVPPVARLVEMKGDSERGLQLFKTTATCSKCHRVRNEGKEVGPDLSEIGTKLSREALFASILDPSAGISHNYETYTALLVRGTIVTGVLVSQTDGSLTLRTAEAIDRTFSSEEIDELTKTQVSLMPADLQKTVDVQGLVDVVEYLGTLKKEPNPP